MKNSMPKVDVERAIYRINELNLNVIGDTVDLKDALKVLDIVVKKNGVVRATKPKTTDAKKETGYAAYVWRMVAFMISKNPVHHCMPVCASFDIAAYDEDGKWRSEIARKIEKELDKIVDIIVDCVDKTEWHGVRRWGKAFGY